MTGWSVLITDGLEESGKAILRSACEVDDRKGISGEELAQVIAGYDALIVRSRTKVTADLLAQASKLKVIGRAGVGVDNIDVSTATERDHRGQRSGREHDGRHGAYHGPDAVPGDFRGRLRDTAYRRARDRRLFGPRRPTGGDDPELYHDRGFHHRHGADLSLARPRQLARLP